jgi:hypothetical protein
MRLVRAWSGVICRYGYRPEVYLLTCIYSLHSLDSRDPITLGKKWIGSMGSGSLTH